MFSKKIICSDSSKSTLNQILINHCYSDMTILELELGNMYKKCSVVDGETTAIIFYGIRIVLAIDEKIIFIG